MKKIGVMFSTFYAFSVLVSTNLNAADPDAAFEFDGGCRGDGLDRNIA